MNKDKLTENKKGNKLVKSISVFIDRFFIEFLFGLFVVILILGYLFLIRDQYRFFIDLKNKQIPTIEEQIEVMVEQRDFFINNSNQLVNFSFNEENILDFVLPNEFNLSSLMVQISSLARSYNILVNDIKVEEPAARLVVSGVNKVIIRLELTVNNYNDWKNFLNAMENSAMIFNIVGINFSQDSSIYNLEIETYYYKL